MKKTFLISLIILLLIIGFSIASYGENNSILEVIEENNFIRSDEWIYDRLYDKKLSDYDLSNAVFIKVCTGFGIPYSQAFDNNNIDKISEQFKNSEAIYYIAISDDYVLNIGKYNSVTDYSENPPLWVSDIINSEIYNSDLCSYNDIEAVYCVTSDHQQHVFYVSNDDVVMFYYEGYNRLELTFEDYILLKSEQNKYLYKLSRDKSDTTFYGYFGLTNFLKLYPAEEIKAAQPKAKTTEETLKSGINSLLKTLPDSFALYCGALLAVSAVEFKKRERYSKKSGMLVMKKIAAALSILFLILLLTSCLHTEIPSTQTPALTPETEFSITGMTKAEIAQYLVENIDNRENPVRIKDIKAMLGNDVEYSIMYYIGSYARWQIDEDTYFKVFIKGVESNENNKFEKIEECEVYQPCIYGLVEEDKIKTVNDAVKIENFWTTSSNVTLEELEEMLGQQRATHLDLINIWELENGKLCRDDPFAIVNYRRYLDPDYVGVDTKKDDCPIYQNVGTLYVYSPITEEQALQLKVGMTIREAIEICQSIPLDVRGGAHILMWQVEGGGYICVAIDDTLSFPDTVVKKVNYYSILSE